MNKHSLRNEDGTRLSESLSRPIIASWQVSNFQSIRDPVELSLAPLTIFSGPNNSGKSTVIKSILMVAQSLGSSAWEVPLVLNGKYTNLGNFDDILHHGCEPPEIELGFVIKQNSDEPITVRTTIENHRTPSQVGSGQSQMRVWSCIMHWGDSDEECLELSYQPVELKADEKQNAGQIVREQINQGFFNYRVIHPKSIESRPQFEEVVSASLANFLPGRVLTRVQSKIRDLALEIEQITNALLASVDEQISTSSIDWESELSEEAKAAFGVVRRRLPQRDRRSREDDYMRALREISKWTSQLTIGRLKEFLEKRLHPGQIGDLSRRLAGSLQEIQRMIANNPRLRKRTELEVRPFPTQHNQIIQQIKQVFGTQVFYLGPLRDDPKVIYAIPPLPNQRDVGLKGEYTAAMLNMHHNRNVDYPLPPPVQPERFDGRYSLKEGKLGEGVQIWLRRMGLVESFETSVTSKVGYKLAVRPEGIERDLDLTSLGVGVSQVLPTIVMGLLAPVNSILIFEQPEVHLHPKVQSILGDFFLGIVACGKQCIIETHSEHLINRIRRRVAESEDARILQQLRIYFAELEDAVSRFRPVEANEYGAIFPWPKGFFDEAEEESSAIIRASTEKRRAARRQRQQKE